MAKMNLKGKRTNTPDTVVDIDAKLEHSAEKQNCEVQVRDWVEWDRSQINV